MSRSNHRPSTETSQQEPEPKEIYEALLRRLDHNTGGVQPPLHTAPSIRGGLCRSGYSPAATSRAITAACAEGDLFRWRDDRDGRLYLGLDDADALREKIHSYVERTDEPRRELIGIANQRIQALEEDGRDE